MLKGESCCCMHVAEAAVVMEALVWCPVQTCLGLGACP